MQHLWELITRTHIIDAIEDLIQSAIADNEQSVAALKRLDNQTIAVTIEPSNISLAISVKNSRLHIIMEADNPDLRVTGSPVSLFKLALAENKQSIIESEPLRIEGATSSLYAWHKLFQSLNLEWEMQLAQRIGPIPARLIITPLKALRKKAKAAMQHLKDNIEHALVWNEYAVTDSELQELSNSSHELRSSVEQLHTRINKLS